ncbi:MAG: LVIVD repeat-containing protein [Candidatus Heimdallarchaeaceae archaeon]
MKHVKGQFKLELFSLFTTFFLILNLSMNADAITMVLIEESSIDTGGETFDIQIVDNIAYVIDTGTSNGFVIINITNRNNPEIISSLNCGSSNSLFIKDDIAYITNGLDGLVIVDVSDPYSPNILGSYNNGGTIHRVVVVENLAYVASGPNGLEIVDVSDPTNPHIINQYGGSYCNALAVDDDVAYITVLNNYLMNVIALNISNPENLVSLGTYQDTNALFFFPTIAEGYLFVADHETASGDMKIIDVTDSTNMFEVSRFETEGVAQSTCIRDNIVYLASGDAGLEVLNIEDISNPVKIAEHNDGGIAYGIDVSNDTIYLADRHDGLELLSYTVDNETAETSLPYLETVFVLMFVGVLVRIFSKKKKLVRRI